MKSINYNEDAKNYPRQYMSDKMGPCFKETREIMNILDKELNDVDILQHLNIVIEALWLLNKKIKTGSLEYIADYQTLIQIGKSLFNYHQKQLNELQSIQVEETNEEIIKYSIPGFPGYYLDNKDNVWGKKEKILRPNTYLGGIRYNLSTGKQIHTLTLFDIKRLVYRDKLKTSELQAHSYEEMMNEMNARGEFNK